MEPTKFDRAIKIVSLLIAVMAVIHIGWEIYQGEILDKVLFVGVQYLAMLLIIVPGMLKKRLNIEMPWMLFAITVLFSFTGLVLGEVLEFYKKFSWWDDLLHAESGFLLAVISLWSLRIALAESEKPIYVNRWFLAIYLVAFSLGLAVIWEFYEFTIDGLLGVNMQQYMASTTGSLVTKMDVPLTGRDALYDTMIDLIYTLVGAVPVAIYCLIRHDKIMARYEKMKEGARK